MSIRKRLRLAFNARFFIKNVDDIMFLLDIKNRVDRHIDVSSRYEPEQVKCFLQMLKNNGCNVFCDVGAHWGYYSLLIAKQPEMEKIEIHAFEPDKTNRYQLYANLFLNKLEHKIKVYDCGISSSSGHVSFHNFHEGNRGRSHISEEGLSRIEVKRLDDVLSIKDKVVGIKIDIEGHEFEAVIGMTELMKNNKCIFQVESFENIFPVLSEQMKKNGYRKIYSIENDHYYSNIENIK